MHGTILRTMAAFIMIAALSACGSTPPPPVATLDAARDAIRNAEQTRALQDAPLELTQAREKLAAADQAVDSRDMEAAERLARESRILAELSVAITDRESARRVNQDIQRSMEMLEEELQRGRRDRGGSS